jgi:hypothetical protein
MTLHVILKIHGLFVQDINVKLKNGQIRLDGEVVTDSSIDIGDVVVGDPNPRFKNPFKFQDFGDFIFNLVKDKENRDFLVGVKDAGLDIDSVGTMSNGHKVVSEFRKVHILRISRREAIVLTKKI